MSLEEGRKPRPRRRLPRGALTIVALSVSPVERREYVLTLCNEYRRRLRRSGERAALRHVRREAFQWLCVWVWRLWLLVLWGDRLT